MGGIWNQFFRTGTNRASCFLFGNLFSCLAYLGILGKFLSSFDSAGGLLKLSLAMFCHCSRRDILWQIVVTGKNI